MKLGLLNEELLEGDNVSLWEDSLKLRQGYQIERIREANINRDGFSPFPSSSNTPTTYFSAGFMVASPI